MYLLFLCCWYFGSLYQQPRGNNVSFSIFFPLRIFIFYFFHFPVVRNFYFPLRLLHGVMYRYNKMGSLPTSYTSPWVALRRFVPTCNERPLFPALFLAETMILDARYYAQPEPSQAKPQSPCHTPKRFQFAFH